MPDLFLISVSKTFLFIGRGLCFDGVEFHWRRAASLHCLGGRVRAGAEHLSLGAQKP